jgi:hypothetical protein
MHRANIVLGGLPGVRRGMHGKQFVTELHDRGFGRDESIALLRLVFGITRGAAKLFVASHPAWAARDRVERFGSIAERPGIVRRKGATE